jgi:hypothetical protein
VRRGKMCPDRQLLSVYLDGELSSPWKEKMEEHICGCVCCTQQIETYRKISIRHSAEEETLFKDARENVWQKLEQRSQVYTYRYKPVSNFWKKRLSIPIPAAAAITLLFLSSFSFLYLFESKTTEMPTRLVSETEYNTPSIIPIVNMDNILHMDNILQFLNSRDNREIIYLQLPENRNFVNFNEPSIIKASDDPRHHRRHQ